MRMKKVTVNEALEEMESALIFLDDNDSLMDHPKFPLDRYESLLKAIGRNLDRIEIALDEAEQK